MKSRMINRRDFIRKIPATGLAVASIGETGNTFAGNIIESPQMQNDFFKIAFDSATMRLNVIRSNGTEFLTGSFIRISSDNRIIRTDNRSYRHTVETVRLSDQAGSGKQMKVRLRDSERKINAELCISLYDNLNAFIIEAGCTNVSSLPVNISQIDPVCALREENGSLFWPEISGLLTNGPMYYDAGEVKDFSSPGADFVRSWWNIGLFRGYDNEGLAIGAVENLSSLGNITARRETGNGISLVAQSILAGGFVLQPGKSVRSNKFIFLIDSNPYSALESYAGYIGKAMKARTGSILNGWCSWFYTYEFVNEEEVIRNAEFASKVLKPYGLEYIQVDEGYQRWHGEWDGNDRFPHGMKWLADRIRSFGLKPGIWIAPYVISEPTDVFRNHQEWLIRHPDGRIKRVGPWPDEDSDWARNENPRRYGLDITHPGAAEWMYQLFSKICNDWGFEMYKIDFVDWSLLSAYRYYDHTVSRAQAYRKGFEIIRRATGPGSHIQDCGPGPVTVGLLDSMRIELDQNYGYRPEVWRQYFTASSSSAPAAAKRYYFHKRTWVNDADHVCLNLLSVTQAQAAASLIGLSGGNILSGDRLPDLDPAKLEILKKILPQYGEAARPVNMFDTNIHDVFALRIQKDFGEWTTAGFFNNNLLEASKKNIPLRRLWLETDKTYIAWDFWNEKLIPDFKYNFETSIPPSSVVLLAIHEKPEQPWVISTDRHIMQGAIELENLRWDSEHKVLTGISKGVRNSSYNIYVYIPDPHPWKQGWVALYHDFPGYTLKMINEHILRVHVRFEESDTVTWEIKTEEFFRIS